MSESGPLDKTSADLERFSPLDDRANPLPAIEGYALEELLGSGASGEVYAAIRLRDDRAVALKVIDLRRADSEEFERRAQQEAWLTWSISHPNVVEVLSWGVHEGGVHIAMERLAGETLEVRLERTGVLAIEAAIAIIRQASRGLSAVHARHAVHRDVKPSNLFLVQGGGIHVKLLDLGIVHLAETDPRRCFKTARGMAIGTPGYMAPEQIYGDNIDGRADIYALGITLYHCLTGHLAVQGPTPQARALETLRQETVPPLPASVPPAISDLIRRATARDRKQRPATIEAFLLELDQAASRVPSELQATLIVHNETVVVGDLTVPQLGDWPGHQRFREHLLFAITRMFSVGKIPEAVVSELQRAATLDDAVHSAAERAAQAVLVAGEFAHDRSVQLEAIQAEIERAMAVRNVRRDAYVRTTVNVEARAATLADIDAQYGNHYVVLERTQRAITTTRARGDSAPFETFFGQEIAQLFLRLDGIQRSRESAQAALAVARETQQNRRRAVALADGQVAQLRGRLMTLEAQQLALVDDAELGARDAELELLRLEQVREHAYLRLGVWVQAAVQ